MNLTEAELQEKFGRLNEPLNPNDLDWRIQGTPHEKNGAFNAMLLPYITNRAVQNRLDDVFGPWNWTNAYREATNNPKGLYCGIGVNINGEWVWKWDGADSTDVEAFKGGLSDAMKRAAVQWGIGRYLYELPKYWGIVEKKTDKIYIIPKTSIPMLPPEALPKGFTYGRAATPPAAVKAPAAPAAVKAPAAAETKAPAVADLKAAAVSAATPAPAGVTPAPKAARSVEENIGAARKYLIPTGYGLPNEGKALGEVLDASQKLGTHVLRILAGRIDGMAIPNPFVATSKEEKQVKAAAEFLLDNAAPVAG